MHRNPCVMGDARMMAAQAKLKKRQNLNGLGTSARPPIVTGTGDIPGSTGSGQLRTNRRLRSRLCAMSAQGATSGSAPVEGGNGPGSQRLAFGLEVRKYAERSVAKRIAPLLIK